MPCSAVRFWDVLLSPLLGSQLKTTTEPRQNILLFPAIISVQSQAPLTFSFLFPPRRHRGRILCIHTRLSLSQVTETSRCRSTHRQSRSYKSHAQQLLEPSPTLLTPRSPSLDNHQRLTAPNLLDLITPVPRIWTDTHIMAVGWGI